MNRPSDGAHSSPEERIAGSGPSQTLRKVVLALLVLLSFIFLFVTESRWGDDSWTHEAIEWTGIGLIVLCILGRTWSTLYIGGRKNDVLVTEGPYSISRNPLYFFSIVGAAGMGAQLGSVTTALAAGFIAWVVFLWTVWREEVAILAAFPAAYPLYLARVPRFLPNFGLWSAPGDRPGASAHGHDHVSRRAGFPGRDPLGGSLRLPAHQRDSAGLSVGAVRPATRARSAPSPHVVKTVRRQDPVFSDGGITSPDESAGHQRLIQATTMPISMMRMVS